jgi:hypothetical protein
MSSIEAALAAIESLKPGEKLVYTQIARKYGFEPTRLAQRHKGASTSLSIRFKNQQVIHLQQEQQFLQYTKGPIRKDLLPTQAIIQNFASQIVKRKLGVN